MLILQRTKLETYTQISRTGNQLKQLRKEVTLCKVMYAENKQQPNSDSIHHIEGIKNIEGKQKKNTAKKNVNSLQKQFIIDTEPTVAKKPLDELRVNQAEI